MAAPALVAVVVGMLILSTPAVYCQLAVGYYSGKCGAGVDVEKVIQGVVSKRFQKEQRIVAGLLRMQFHECGVQGCDGSLLLDGPASEKTAPPNLTVFGYDLIDDIKAAVEAVCPGVVSCADIQIAATRDAVVLAGGTHYDVQMGRKDGRASSAARVNLPEPESTVAQAAAFFATLGLNLTDAVLLLGAHTVGITHCVQVKTSRLYNSDGTARNDSTMDPTFRRVLRDFPCPNNASSDDNTVFLDEISSALTVDNSYYQQLRRGRGVLPIDANLYLDKATSSFVDTLAANGSDFTGQFGQALVRLGAVGVLTGAQGEIRRNCSSVN